MRAEARRQRRLAALSIAAWLGLASAAAAQAPIANAESSAPASGRQLEGPALLDALRRGGHVVYFRHTATDFSKNDSAMRNFGDCANQRLLSTQGRRDATQLGERFRALKIPVGEVFASPMCRTTEHAKLAFRRAEPKPEMRESDGGRYPGLATLLAAPVPAGSNRVLVGHGIPFRAIAGPPHLAEGEASVIAPGGDRWTVVARVGVEAWGSLGATR